MKVAKIRHQVRLQVLSLKKIKIKNQNLVEKKIKELKKEVMETKKKRKKKKKVVQVVAVLPLATLNLKVRKKVLK